MEVEINLEEWKDPQSDYNWLYDSSFIKSLSEDETVITVPKKSVTSIKSRNVEDLLNAITFFGPTVPYEFYDVFFRTPRKVITKLFLEMGISVTGKYLEINVGPSFKPPEELKKRLVKNTHLERRSDFEN
jgi:hypothetical protein